MVERVFQDRYALTVTPADQKENLISGRAF
jgi:hypothetical protein